MGSWPDPARLLIITHHVEWLTGQNELLTSAMSACQLTNSVPTNCMHGSGEELQPCHSPFKVVICSLELLRNAGIIKYNLSALITAGRWLWSPDLRFSIPFMWHIAILLNFSPLIFITSAASPCNKELINRRCVQYILLKCLTLSLCSWNELCDACTSVSF